MRRKKKGGGLGNQIIKTKSEDDLFDLIDDNDWRIWAFKKAVMKPEYKNIDCAKLAYPYGIVISERLKNALEEANLTGFEIKPFPVKFEYL